MSGNATTYIKQIKFVWPLKYDVQNNMAQENMENKGVIKL